MSIQVKKLKKQFNGYLAVNDVSFSVAEGQFVTLLGPSGSGKSTILRMIAGLEHPTDGSILIHGEEVTQIPVQKRKVGFVFQHYALFRHMTVLENIAFGLKVRRVKKQEREAKAKELLKLVGLENMEDRFPSQLSGGQRQRVALARALAPEPALLLLDEPFGALDTRLRKELRTWLKKLHERIRLTTLLVTHDQEEAFELSDRVLVVNHGRIEQNATPQTIFDRPASEFVAKFVGETNQVRAEVIEDRLCWGDFIFNFPAGLLTQQSVTVLFRPSDVYVTSHPEEGAISGVIQRIQFLGVTQQLLIEFEKGHELVAHVPQGVAEQSQFAEGKKVFVSITKFHLFG